LRTLRWEFYDVKTDDAWTLYPLGDVHLGAATCDEKLLRSDIQTIANDPRGLWVGMGDYCLSEDTTILTDHGWRTVDTIRQDDMAVVFDPPTEACSFEPIRRKWVNRESEEMVRLTSSHIDVLVTGNHRILVNHNVRGRWKGYEVKEAQELVSGKIKHIWRLPVAVSDWEGMQANSCLNEDWCSLKGWIDTEGSIETVGNSERLQVAQSETANPQHAKSIEELIERLGLSPHRSKRKWGVVVWRFSAGETRLIHSAIGRKCERRDEIMNAPLSYLRAYFTALMNGDGTWTRQCFAQKNKELVSIFQELCFKLGYRARITARPYDNGWQCHFGNKKGLHSLLRQVEAQPYTGRTWCITTDKGFIVTRRNDKVVVLGNCDWINTSDPRYNVSTLADWLVTKRALADLAKAQRDRFLEYVEPIAHKCIGLLAGNHETAIQRHYERGIYNEIVSGVKALGGFAADRPLTLGYHGWLQLAFYHATDRKGGSHVLNVNLHHGFVGGRLGGAKTLNMQRWLWTHPMADLVLMGHSHNIDVNVAATYGIDRYGHHTEHVAKVAYTGAYLRSVNDQGPDTYAEVAGYLPAAVGGIQVLLHPMAMYQPQRVQVRV